MFLSMWPFLPQSPGIVLCKVQERPSLPTFTTTGMHAPQSGRLTLEVQHPWEHELASAQQAAEVRHNSGLVQLLRLSGSTVVCSHRFS